MSLQNCSECGSSVTASQLRCLDAVRCSSLCRRAFHTGCVDIPPEAVQLLINLPTLLWQCDNCVVANNSHSKIDELTEKVKTLETICWDLNKQFRSEIASRPVPQQQPEPVPRQAVAAAPFTLAREGDWNAAWNKKRNMGNAEPEFLVGVAPNCSELEVMQSKRYLHVGKFAVDTEPEAVVKYVADKLNVTPKELTCCKLVKKNAVLSALRFVNFKLGIPEHLYGTVFNNEFWPMSVKVGHFVNVERFNANLGERQRSTPDVPVGFWDSR